MDDLRKDCLMRHENGNCTVIGGFCTAVNDHICEGLHSAYDSGYRAAAIRAKQELTNNLKVLERNDPLTLDELRHMDGEPVWVIFDKGFESLALWALVNVCEEYISLTNNLGGRTEYATDVELEDDGITVYRRKLEEGEL